MDRTNLYLELKQTPTATLTGRIAHNQVMTVDQLDSQQECDERLARIVICCRSSLCAYTVVAL
jgi:hypothetical protein